MNLEKSRLTLLRDRQISNQTVEPSVTLRVGLTNSQLRCINGTLVYHQQHNVEADVTIDGVRYKANDVIIVNLDKMEKYNGEIGG
jgi:hypothetical protein